MGKKIIDNPFYFYLWVKENQEEVRCVWIVKDKALADEKNDKFYSLSRMGLYYQFVARVCVCSHSTFSDFNPLVLLLRRGMFKVQLWHGAPMKKIMADLEVGWFKMIKQRLYDGYDLVLSPGPKFTNIIQNAFRVSSTQVITAKYPRIKPKSQDGNLILYAPTYRDGNSFNYFNNLNFGKIDKILRKLNYVLLIRLHPSLNAKKSLKEEVVKLRNIEIDETPDVGDILPKVSVLISDYSGIIFDFLYYKRPIIYAPFDLEEYVHKTRGLYLDYEEISVKPLAFTWDEICNQLKNIDSYDYERLSFLHGLYCCDEDDSNSKLFARINNAINAR